MGAIKSLANFDALYCTKDLAGCDLVVNFRHIDIDDIAQLLLSVVSDANIAELSLYSYIFV